uniref:(northern house mosquito) hypothetical protein n=1 Tax=Culex pipiens TaxID=7175 RepID=A0A8D8AWX7_CULPI
MGQKHRVPAVLRGPVRRVRQRVALPVHGLQQRRWSVRDTVPDRAVHHRTAGVLPGDGSRAVLQPGLREGVRSCSGDARDRSRSNDRDLHGDYVLRSDSGDYLPVSGGVVQRGAAVEYVRP